MTLCKTKALPHHPANPPRMVRTPAGEAELRPEIFDPVVASLIRAGRQPVSVRALIDQPECAALTPWQVWETLLILMGVCGAGRRFRHA
jgi:hypothetical protein